jgi:hypothetical protein
VAALLLVAPALAGGKGPQAGKRGNQGAPANSGITVSVQGVVQAVSSSTVLVKQLDGSAVVVPIDGTTHVYVNGKPAHWGEVKRGFVLIASWQSGRPAGTLRFLRPS